MRVIRLYSSRNQCGITEEAAMRSHMQQNKDDKQDARAMRQAEREAAREMARAAARQWHQAGRGYLMVHGMPTFEEVTP